MFSYVLRGSDKLAVFKTRPEAVLAIEGIEEHEYE